MANKGNYYHLTNDKGNCYAIGEEDVMKKTDLAYTAGIIDGEGCVYIGKFNKRKNKYPSYQLHVTVNSSDEWLCQFLKMGYGGSVHKYLSPRNTKMYLWHIAALKALVFLGIILPYLHIKQPQAEIAIQFQSQLKTVGRRGRTEEVVALQEEQRLLLKNAKKVGKAI